MGKSPNSTIETVAVCSARPRALTHTGRKGGNQWWARDIYHLRRIGDATRTRCGRDCSEWPHRCENCNGEGSVPL